jgi:hypothetical protein
LRHRAFCTSFAFSFLGSQETRDSGEVSNGNLGFWFGRGCFLVGGHFLSRGDRGCGEKGWEKWLGKEMIGKEMKHTRSFIFASTGDAMTSMRDVVPVTFFSGGYAVRTLLVITCYSAGNGSFRMGKTMVTLKWER